MPSFTKFYRGLHPRYIWKDGIVGSRFEFVGTHEESESWMALFLDLLYVCLFSKLSEILGECDVTLEVLLFCGALVMVFFISRLTIGNT